MTLPRLIFKKIGCGLQVRVYLEEYQERYLMLDAFIIEQLRRREEEVEEPSERPSLQLPLVDDVEQDREIDEEHKEPQRVIIIDL